MNLKPMTQADRKRFNLLIDAMRAHLEREGWQTEEQIEDAVRGKAPHNDIMRAIALGLETAVFTVEQTGHYDGPVHFGLKRKADEEKGETAWPL